MRNRVGQLIADERLNISDSPHLIDGFGYTLFDSEGTKTATTSLIKEGYLQTLAHNSATAKHFGVKTTGHASRSPKSTLGINLHQLHIGEGNDSESTLYSGEYLLITDLAGLHSGANPISGQFSFGASGYLMTDGVRVRPVECRKYPSRRTLVHVIVAQDGQPARWPVGWGSVAGTLS